MAIRTLLTDLFGIRHPIVLAPMGMIAGGTLAAAVTRAGGLGIIGGGYGNREWLEREFAAAGNERVGTGFITWSLARQPELLDLALERAPAAIFLSFGDARPFTGKIKAAGTKLILQVQTMAQAKEAKELGADVIVAQGTEAGGHGSTSRALFPLLPAVVDAVAPTPVLAAGGISDGRQLAAALLLGATGVLVGTRLFASKESLGHANAKTRIIEAGGDDTLRTEVFDVIREFDWPKPYTGRAIANELSKNWHGREAELAAAMASEKPRYQVAAAQGDFDQAVIFAGEGLDLIRDVPAASAIVERMVSEAEANLHAGAALVGEAGR